VWGVVFAILVLPALIVGYETAMHFSGVAIDGPFQLYDALRRIKAGFRPGVDFQFFHGLGVPYAHYGLYRLFGGGLKGSELARELLATTLYPIEYVLIFRVFTRGWRKAIALAAAAMAISFLLHMSALLFALNGMLSLRSALPTALAAILVLCKTRPARVVAGGVTIGLSLFMSTEQGLAVMLAFILVSVVLIARPGDRRAATLDLVATLATALATLCISLLIVGGFSGLRGALRYNFRVVPMDQYWYFGAPPNAFIPSWGTGFRMLVRVPIVGLSVVLALVATVVYLRRAWVHRTGEEGRIDTALAVLPAYALISCASLLGIFTPAYVQPCLRCLIVIAAIELLRVGNRLMSSDRQRFFGVPSAIALGTAILIVAALVTTPLLLTSLGKSLPHIVRDHAFGHERFSIAAPWPETLERGQQAIDAHKGAHGELPELWSTYAGWIEARNGLFHPSFDYIIHALGPENRTAYVARFHNLRPGLAQTVRPTYTQYETWIENENWAFYDELLDRYRVYSLTPWSIFWEPRPEPAPELQPIGTMNVPNGLHAVPLPPIPATSTAATLLEVEVEYTTRNPLEALPVIGASPRYLVGIEGALSNVPVSLDPHVNRVRFPMLVLPGQTPTLHFETFSLLPGASWTPKTLRVFVRPIDAGAEPWLRDAVAYLSKQR